MNELKNICIVTVVIGACLLQVPAMRCYSCKNFQTSEDCMNVTQCTFNEVCYARADGLSTGDVQYTVGCSRDRSAVREDSTFCSDVCMENLCNLNKCNIPVSPKGKSDRPPRCLSCELTTSPNICTNLVQCNENEICYVREVTVYGNKRFRLGCMNKQHCSTRSSVTANPITIVGKRFTSSTNSSALTCSVCCENDHCNALACQQNLHLSVGPSHQLDLIGDNTTCVDKNVDACVAFGSLDSNACVILPKVDEMCPKTCGICGHFGWSEWSIWSDCSQTCNEGTVTRTRTCLHQIDIAHAHNCIGGSKESKSCNDGICLIEGTWSDWESWGSCSLTCLNGTRSRVRHCTSTDQSQGGLFCSGDHLDISFCNQQACPVETTCPDNWIAYHSSCYFFEHSAVTFSNAQSFCHARKSTMVHIESASENTFIVDHLNTFSNPGNGWWIGMTDSDVEGTWKWTDTNQRVNYTNWNTSEGNSDGEDCCILYPSYSFKMADVGCETFNAKPLCELK
ncbi:uncharacterized protein LOC123535345 isoform X3 [Mercenaria mercenaria]|uniref:uncharacterized protein LOC123535345 isoform X3 n=1 Tax=Mercenaria mercenaria TaxID=6596 RepID=UPI00234EB9BB|nr:uncharacterized protein LOC123535345 isoform X3 [Mercenaria mercenaria]